MSNIKPTVPFSFDEIYAGVEQKFLENGYDIQQGSNTMQLANAMAYMVSMLNANTAVNINENILTLARKRKNILQDSRLLGYEPGNKVSYQYILELTLPAGDFILPKHSIFTANNKKYYYMGDYIQMLDVVEGTKINIEVKEGTLIKYDEDASLSIITKEIVEDGITRNQYYVDIAYTNIEDDGIECYLTYYDDNGDLINKEKWVKLNTFTVDSDTILHKQFYRLNRIDLDLPRIYFKLPNTGDNIRLGTKIEINILQSSGSTGVMTELPSTSLNCEVTNYTLKIEGTEEEETTNIKQNAPLFWNSANRAVTKNDYLSICNRLTQIDKTYVWDGNQEYPKIAGKIWFSFVPQTKTRRYLNDAYKTAFELDLLDSETNWFLENTEVSNIFDYLDIYKIPTMELLHRNPTLLDFTFDVEILKYDIAKTESEQNQIIFNIINEYFHNVELNAVENFEIDFFGSNLIKRIDTQTTDITGINVTLKNDITLYNKNIVNEGSAKYLIVLGLPFDEIYNPSTGDLIPSSLPQIDTTDFTDFKDLTVDFSGLTGNEKNIYLVEFDILLGTDIVGKYKIFNNTYILIELNVDGIILTEANTNQKILNVSYKTNNIQIKKNTIPRLKRVNFI